MIEEIEQRLAEYLYSGAKEFYYKGHRFEINEWTYSNPMEFTSMIGISIKVPTYLSKTLQDVYSTFYVKQDEKPRTETQLRADACMKLAREFIKNVLPKIDYEIEKELHNRKINEILEVLE